MGSQERGEPGDGVAQGKREGCVRDTKANRVWQDADRGCAIKGGEYDMQGVWCNPRGRGALAGAMPANTDR